MKFSELVAQRFPKLKKQVSDTEHEEDLLKTLYYYRKEFGLSWKELMEEPLPSFLIFLEQINKENEKGKKEMDKAKRKR